MSILKEVVYQARKGNELPFNRFLEHTFKNLKGQLLRLTQSQNDANEVYIESMQKFWEQFVIENKDLPQNPEAYIYSMCRNLWLIKKRGVWNKVILKDSLTSESCFGDTLDFNEKKERERNDFLKKKSLTMALNKISPKCRELIELGMRQEKKSKDAMEKLGYTTYQALIQARYNCKKRLIKKVFQVLSELKKNEK